MTERERFEIVVEEVGALIERVADLAEVVLIGGQVIAVERLAAGHDPVLQVETDTGQVLTRGYSLEADLLVDPPYPEQSARWDELPHLLRECGFRRGPRDYQWDKEVRGELVRLELFVPEDAPEPATAMTRLPGGDEVLTRATPVMVGAGARRSIKVPDPVSYLRLKLDARLRLRDKPKDSFDLFAYARWKGPGVIRAALRSSQRRGELAAELRELFGAITAPGVLDVLGYATSLEGLERELVAADVVRCFEEVVG